MNRSSLVLRWPLHPILLVVSFILAAGYANEVPFAATVRPGLVGAGIAGLAVGLLLLLARSVPRACVLTTAGLVALISLDLLRGLVTLVGEALGYLAAFIIVGIAVFALLAAGAIRLLRRRGRPFPLEILHRTLNQGAIVLLATVLVTGVLGGAASGGGPAAPGSVSFGCNQDLGADADTPDIYQILLDGYPRADVLEERFGFDNTPFLQALREDEFAVDDRSHSNYTFTALTFSSMFNMRYLQDIPDLAPLVGSPVRGRSEVLAAINTGTVFSILREAGYHVITTPSGWEHVTTRGAADEFLDHGDVTDFERNLVERTWIPELSSWIAGDWFAAAQRSRVRDAFADIASISARTDEGPLYLFAHVPIPHHPIVFGRAGAPLTMSSLRDWSRQVADLGKTDAQYDERYVDQLAYVNELVLQAVSAIDSSPRSRPAVVIVMGDHGYTHDLRRVDPRDKLSNLMAARTTGMPGLLLNTTPVNLFPRLLTAYLGVCVEPLSDRYFVSPNQKEMLNFAEVANPESRIEPDFGPPDAAP